MRYHVVTKALAGSDDRVRPREPHTDRRILCNLSTASFKRCGWKAVITADNRRELLSVRLKDSWERDLLPAQSA